MDNTVRTRNAMIRTEDIPEWLLELVEVLGIDVVYDICLFLGGVKVYIPKLETLLRKRRDREIYNQFDGGNCIELARKYRLSSKQIERILKTQRREKQQRITPEQEPLDDCVPDTLRDFVDVFGVETLIEIAKLYGGLELYFPVVASLSRSTRNMEIRARYHDRNFHELSCLFRLSERQIRKITQDIHTAEKVLKKACSKNISLDFQIIKENYEKGLWDISVLNVATRRGLLSENQFKEITGEEYTE